MYNIEAKNGIIKYVRFAAQQISASVNAADTYWVHCKKAVYSCLKEQTAFCTPEPPLFMWFSGSYAYYSNSQNQIYSIQFCIGDLILFDFICFQLPHFYAPSQLALSIRYHDNVITLA